MSLNNWMLPKQILAIGLVIPFVVSIGATAAPLVNEGNSRSARANADNQEIQVAVSRQDAKGKTQQDLDMNFLNNLESFIVDRLKVKAKEYQSAHGYQNSDSDLTSEASYIEYGKIKLAVVRIRVPEGANQLWVTGIKDNEIIRIACVRKSIETIPITYGNCGNKIESIFGKRIGY